jgi:predicted nuclease of predicted toxin-antitoxin system
VRFLLDADIQARGLVRGLRERGHDVVIATDLPEHVYRDDEALLRAATLDGRIFVTHNLVDFPDILRGWGQENIDHAGVILSSLAANRIGEILRRILRLADARPRHEQWKDLACWI